MLPGTTREPHGNTRESPRESIAAGGASRGTKGVTKEVTWQDIAQTQIATSTTLSTVIPHLASDFYPSKHHQ